MIEWYKIWVPFVATLCSAIISALVAIAINYKQNKSNNEQMKKQFDNSIHEIEKKHQLSTEWNSKKELLMLKTNQGEKILKSSSFISSNIHFFFKSSFYKDDKELEKIFREEISKLEILSCYFPDAKSDLNIFLYEYNSLFNDLVISPYLDKNKEFFKENNNKISKELLELCNKINKYSKKISEEISWLVNELEKYSKHS
ncbi:hypothetical protein ABQD64_05240 [Vagococcus fluvialis]|uniref:hypothetical protein n=1 Tax=Vagococcus fluvialis TaxID=2738 RepID=UPI0032E4AE04